MRKISIKKEILKNLYLDKKLSSTEIGRLFKLTKQAIFYYLKKYNISRRTGNEVKKGELHPNFGKRGIFASGYKNGIYCKENYCDDCGIIIRNKYAKRCKPCSLKYYDTSFKKGHLVSNEIKRKISLALGGTGIPRENSNYGIEFDYKLKYRIFNRDGFTCQNCGQIGTKKKNCLATHHIDYDKKNCKEDNLITTCKRCNSKANFNRNYWQEFYTTKIIQKGNKKNVK